MMISTRGRYAIRVMLDLAQHQQEGYQTRDLVWKWPAVREFP